MRQSEVTKNPFVAIVVNMTEVLDEVEKSGLHAERDYPHIERRFRTRKEAEVWAKREAQRLGEWGRWKVLSL